MCQMEENYTNKELDGYEKPPQLNLTTGRCTILLASAKGSPEGAETAPSWGLA